MASGARLLPRCAFLTALALFLGGSARSFSPWLPRRSRRAPTARAAAAVAGQSGDFAEGNGVVDALRKDVARYEADLERLQTELELYVLDGQLQLLETERARLAQELSKQQSRKVLDVEEVPAREQPAREQSSIRQERTERPAAEQQPQEQQGSASSVLQRDQRDRPTHFASGKRDFVLPAMIALAAAVSDKADELIMVGSQDLSSSSSLNQRYASDSEQVLRHMKVAVSLQVEAANREQWNNKLQDEMATWLKRYDGNRALAKRQSFVSLKKLIEDISPNLRQPVPRAMRLLMLERIGICRDDLANGL